MSLPPTNYFERERASREASLHAPYPEVPLDPIPDGSYITSLKEKLNIIAKSIKAINLRLETADGIAARQGHTGSSERALEERLDRLRAVIADYTKTASEIAATQKLRTSQIPTIGIPPNYPGDSNLDDRALKHNCPPCGTTGYPQSTFPTFIHKLFAHGIRNVLVMRNTCRHFHSS
jgi:hypothetical protein